MSEDFPLLFRFHRGLLNESMKTAVPINSFSELIDHIGQEMDMSLVKIFVNKYIYDERINWDTHIVTGVFRHYPLKVPIGFFNKKPMWDTNMDIIHEE